MRSGAIITAEAAIDQGKEIFCIPPCNISEPACMGVAPFIRDGAKIAMSGYDIAMMYGDVYRTTLKQEIYQNQMYLFRQAEESADMPAPKKKDGIKNSAETKKSSSRRKTSASEEKAVEEKTVHSVDLSEYPDDDPRRLILSLLSDEPRMLDDLQQQSQLPTNRLLQVLLDLEMNGIIESLGGQRYKLA